MVRREAEPRLAPTHSLVKKTVKDPLAVVITASPASNGEALEPALRLARGSCILGAGADADLLIADETVSRAHARLTLVAEGILVEDLNSRNGTFYSGQRIRSIYVEPGATLRLGSSSVRVELDQPLSSVALAGPETYGQLVAESAQMRSLFASLRRLEGSLVSVLVQGESGTGKELIARAIHDNSPVSQGPFVAVNCGALQASLARSELFGHKKGAFTGAVSEHRGAFEEAEGGTLFLDEIGDLPADVQPMLLRALEERAITRVGSVQSRPINVRVIAATHRELADAARAGGFREDLYYRLAVVQLRIPALRERPEDVPLLAKRFAQQTAQVELAQETLDALAEHSWPGNVRELRHAVECFLAVGQLPQLVQTGTEPSSPQFLSVNIAGQEPYHQLKSQVLDQFTQKYLERLLERCDNNVTLASKVSGLERSYLNKLAKKYQARG